MLNRLALISIAFLTLGLISSSVFARDNKIQEIQDRGVLRACLAEAIPNNFKDPKDGKWKGFNPDLGYEIAKEMGVEIEFVDATWATIIPSVITDKCDMALVGLFRLAKRARVILFANAFTVTTLSAAVPKGSSIDTYEALDDPEVSIALISGTAEESYVKSGWKSNVKSLVTDKVSSMFLEVASGRADATVTDTVTLRNFLKQNPTLKLRELSAPPIVPRGSAWAVAPGEYHFQQYLNVFLERAETSGLKATLWNKWHKND